MDLLMHAYGSLILACARFVGMLGVLPEAAKRARREIMMMEALPICVSEE